MANVENLSITLTGNIFTINTALCTIDAAGSVGSFKATFRNESGDKIDVNVDRNDPAVSVVATGIILNGDSKDYSEVLSLYSHVKVTRWRPGVFGVMGNGGGDFTFSVPKHAIEIQLDVTVVG